METVPISSMLCFKTVDSAQNISQVSIIHHYQKPVISSIYLLQYGEQLWLGINQCCSLVVSTPMSHSGGPGLKYQFKDWLP